MLSPKCDHEGAYAGTWVFTSAPCMEGKAVQCILQSEYEVNQLKCLPDRLPHALVRLIEEIGKEA